MTNGIAAHLFSTPRVLALNGDSYCGADLAAFVAAHVDSRCPASLLLANVDDVSRYGAVQCDASGRLTRFEEKGAATGPGWINAGVYLFDRSLLEEIPEGRSVSLEREMFPAWLERGIHGFFTTAPFLDIGTPETYARAAEFFAAAIRSRSPA